LFVRDLWFAVELKEFELFGYTVMPDHVHLLFEPRGKFNYSQIVHNIKRVFSLHANQIMFSAPPDELIASQLSSVGDDIYHRLRWTDVLVDLHMRFQRERGCRDNIPHFRWQPSFRDHIIRNQTDYQNHLEYIYNNAVKHGVAHKPEEHPFTWTQGMRRPFVPD
jgi:REP element-mobilizing transposase RayT